MFFVSGAVIEYTQPNVKTISDKIIFYYKRIVRLYPAYWMSLIIGIFCLTILSLNNVMVYSLDSYFLYPNYLFLDLVGISVYMGRWGGAINPVGWFIGVILILYLLYPFLSKVVKKYPFPSVFISTAISIISMYLIENYVDIGIGGLYNMQRWFPTINIFAFVIGIYVVQNKLYPTCTYNNKLLCYISELSFYVFLIHTVVWELIPINIYLWIIVVLLLSIGMMILDKKIQRWLLKHPFNT